MDKVVSIVPKIEARRERKAMMDAMIDRELRAYVASLGVDPDVLDLEFEMEIDANGNTIMESIRLVGEGNG